jgi:hypothetical protein
VGAWSFLGQSQAPAPLGSGCISCRAQTFSASGHQPIGDARLTASECRLRAALFSVPGPRKTSRSSWTCASSAHAAGLTGRGVLDVDHRPHRLDQRHHRGAGTGHARHAHDRSSLPATAGTSPPLPPPGGRRGTRLSSGRPARRAKTKRGPVARQARARSGGVRVSVGCPGHPAACSPD